MSCFDVLHLHSNQLWIINCISKPYQLIKINCRLTLLIIRCQFLPFTASVCNSCHQAKLCSFVHSLWWAKILLVLRLWCKLPSLQWKKMALCIASGKKGYQLSEPALNSEEILFFLLFSFPTVEDWYFWSLLLLPQFIKFFSHRKRFDRKNYSVCLEKDIHDSPESDFLLQQQACSGVAAKMWLFLPHSWPSLLFC